MFLSAFFNLDKMSYVSIYCSWTEVCIHLKWIEMLVENTVSSNHLFLMRPGLALHCPSLNVLTFKTNYTYLIHGKVKYLATRAPKLVEFGNLY